MSQGEHILQVESLGPKEYFTLQLLSYKTIPVLLNVRSKEGVGQPIQIQPQWRLFPKWVQMVASGLMLVGFGFIIYWVTMAVIYISKSINIT